jgi:hypothetical protein
MNEYEFEYELTDDGWYYTYRTFAANKLAAYENFIAFLKECNEDPEKARVLTCYVAVAEGEEG